MTKTTKTTNEVFDDALSGDSSIGWRFRRRIAELHPGQVVVDGVRPAFDLAEFTHGERCKTTRVAESELHLDTSWRRGLGVMTQAVHGAFDVEWNGETLRVYTTRWREGYETRRNSIVVAATEDLALRFINEVCEFCNVPRRAVLRFTGGCWGHSRDLFDAIARASFDDLVLAGDLKERISHDFSSFLGARADYERFGVPYRRGVLFLGPPGNGKTHCLRAVLKMLAVPVLYVQSLQAKYVTEDANIEDVFQRAHQVTPCCLVFEDLDAMITDRNRSAFLNQLDGLGNLSGVLTIATTNHPDRLDPAIVDRPSRFDRKYHFNLPAPSERGSYLGAWNQRLDPEMRIEPAALDSLVEHTSDFSFAYLKELYVSSMMRWMEHRRPSSMAGVLQTQAAELRLQMRTPVRSSAAAQPADSDDDEAPL